MSSTADESLTPGRRLARGLAYTAVGPLDIGRGVLGLGVASTRAAAANARLQIERARLRRQLAAAQEARSDDIAATQEAVAELPAVIVRIGKSHRARRIGLITGIAVVTVAGGAVAFSIIRRSMQPDPSALPPSVEVDPHP